MKSLNKKKKNIKKKNHHPYSLFGIFLEWNTGEKIWPIGSKSWITKNNTQIFDFFFCAMQPCFKGPKKAIDPDIIISNMSKYAFKVYDAISITSWSHFRDDKSEKVDCYGIRVEILDCDLAHLEKQKKDEITVITDESELDDLKAPAPTPQ